MVPAGQAKPRGSPEGAHIEFRNVTFAYPSRPDIQVASFFTLHHHYHYNDASPYKSRPGDMLACETFGYLARHGMAWQYTRLIIAEANMSSLLTLAA